jgi:hypothetical protein
LSTASVSQLAFRHLASGTAGHSHGQVWHCSAMPMSHVRVQNNTLSPPPFPLPPSSRAHICKPFKEPQESIPPPYVAWRPSTTNRVIISTRQAGNRFLGSLKGYKYGLMSYMTILVIFYDNLLPKLLPLDLISHHLATARNISQIENF